MAVNQSRKYLNQLELINNISDLTKQNKGIDETLRQIVDSLPELKTASTSLFIRIIFNKTEYKTKGFDDANNGQERNFVTTKGNLGSLQIYTRVNKPVDDIKLKDEQKNFLSSFENILLRYLNAIERKEHKKPTIPENNGERFHGTISDEFLQKFLNINTYNRDVYHDLMPFKVKEILLISSLYDAYAIEKEGRFSEHMLGQYGQLNLTTFPRITGASTAQHVFELLGERHFDLVIYMVGVEKQQPLTVGKKIKAKYPYLPIFLLLNNRTDASFYIDQTPKIPFIDKVFTWNGDANIFFAMIKLLEDKINAENDTKKGQVRMVLVVEDTPAYYTRYLSFLYRVVMEQTKRIIDDVGSDELYKVLRMRARPKILHASSFEEATKIFKKYRDYMLCLITDVKFPRKGKIDENAGLKLLDLVQSEIKNLPTILQSADSSFSAVAEKYDSLFIHKQSETLYQDIHHFITNYLGFGDFVFKDADEKTISTASNLRAFEKQLKLIPDSSLVFHASRDHLSMWLMARGEIRAASVLNPKKVSDFSNTDELRHTILALIKEHRNEQDSGNILPFSESQEIQEDNIYTLADGSLGGKGRGLAFINALINKYDFDRFLPDIKVRTPKTFVVGVQEFEHFVKINELADLVLEADYKKIRKVFFESTLSESLKQRLTALLNIINRPIAVRSSGLFEDSLTQPFAGIFETYLLPNNHPDPVKRLEQVCGAIKLVFASVFSNTAKGYVKAIDYKLEEEKMAVIIQEVVGNQFDNLFYPHISGVAQSYNFYPFAHMKPEEGYGVAAVGLGKYVVEGNRAYRFSPKYPGTEINSPKDQFRNSQVEFYGVAMDKKDIDLLEGEFAGLRTEEISTAERHGALKHCASVYNPDSRSIFPGLAKAGPRIVNFANVLRYNYIPLAKTIDLVLALGRDAMGTAVEIEYAVDLNKDKDGKASFYILQIKPLIAEVKDCKIDMKKVDDSSLILYSEKGMGNGHLDHMTDLIYVDTAVFDKSKTVEMAHEIEQLNNLMQQEKRQYVLIGPGRWGTRDPWIGIPVKWHQISNAKVIVETSLDEFPLDASSGSHFFHNVTTMNVGYFTVQPEMSRAFIQYDVFEKQELIRKGKYFRHIRFEKPFHVKMDGKQRLYIIHS